MLSTQSLRDQLNRYADGSLSAEALEEWLASETWDMSRWAPRGLQRLVESIQASFIDCSDGRISERELNEILIRRREQLQLAREVTEKIRASSASLAKAIEEARRSTVAVSEALILEPVSV